MDTEAHIDVVAPLLGLEIDADWRPGVAAFLALAADMAARLDAVPLDDAEFALAPVYTPRGGDER